MFLKGTKTEIFTYSEQYTGKLDFNQFRSQLVSDINNLKQTKIGPTESLLESSTVWKNCSSDNKVVDAVE